MDMAYYPLFSFLVLPLNFYFAFSRTNRHRIFHRYLLFLKAGRRYCPPIRFSLIPISSDEKDDEDSRCVAAASGQ
ncbi:unnamed protein product [Lactuca virosa]|uniref:Secreted protein n=1 Tax=Lactuca virosa TaxID=75947 RepID=A0AAU9PAI3_9ASTR|nr:unnamed protein product [Lactuca virosa]